MTVIESVDRFHETDPLHVTNRAHDRLWVHDLLHMILNASATTADGEEITAIFQAVLLRDDRVRFGGTQHRDGGTDILPGHILNRVIPGIRTFTVELGRRNGFRPKPSSFLGVSEIMACYEQATNLARAFQDRFGKRFGEMTVEELKAIPRGDYLAMVRAVRTQRPERRSRIVPAAAATAGPRGLIVLRPGLYSGPA